MMHLIVNGEEKIFNKGVSLEQIIVSLKIDQKVMAAAVNMKIVKKDQWATFKPNDGDKIEFLHFVGGG